MTRPFDAAAFQRTFAAAQRCGVDLDDCTSYQRALVLAEIRHERTVSAPDYGWWRGRDIFSEKEQPIVRIIEVEPHEPEEAEADPMIPFSAEMIRELWREVRREVVDLDKLSLRTLRQRPLIAAAMAGA